MKTIIPDVSIRSIASCYRVIRFPYLLSPSNMVKKKQEMLSVRQELNGFTEPMRIRNHPIYASTLLNI